MRTLENTPLWTYERQAITEAVTTLTQQFPVEQAILFGSKARGDSDAYSDIDLLLIMSQATPWQDKKAIVDMLFDVGMKYDVLFSFLCVQREEWNGGIFTELPIYREILQDGANIL